VLTDRLRRKFFYPARGKYPAVKARTGEIRTGVRIEYGDIPGAEGKSGSSEMFFGQNR
jgi:hypothetical protein